jgi:hypothetical protein
VWHGSADRTVNPANANEIVKQWLDVHDLPSAPMSEGTVDGYPHQVWWDADGDTIIESYTITNMAHGTPLGIADNEERYGAQGAFLIEAGISSSYHIANFFGLTERTAASQEVANSQEVAKAASKKLSQELVKKEPATEAAKPAPASALADARRRDITTALRPLGALNRDPEPPHQPRRNAIDVSAVIARALTAAGLMK